MQQLGRRVERARLLPRPVINAQRERHAVRHPVLMRRVGKVRPERQHDRREDAVGEYHRHRLAMQYRICRPLRPVGFDFKDQEFAALVSPRAGNRGKAGGFVGQEIRETGRRTSQTGWSGSIASPQVWSQSWGIVIPRAPAERLRCRWRPALPTEGLRRPR